MADIYRFDSRNISKQMFSCRNPHQPPLVDEVAEEHATPHKATDRTLEVDEDALLWRWTGTVERLNHLRVFNRSSMQATCGERKWQTKLVLAMEAIDEASAIRK